MGFTRDQAALALKLGWTEEEVMVTHDSIGDDTRYGHYGIHKVYDWGVAISAWKEPPFAVVYKGEPMRPYKDKAAICYTDGSGTTANKTAGIGVYVEEGEERKLIAENIGCGTNNVAELKAIWRALREFPYRNKQLLIRSDSEYAIGILTNLDWLAQANTDLVRRIREDLALRKYVTMEHVDGHKGIEGNEIADGLANIGRKRIKTVTTY